MSKDSDFEHQLRHQAEQWVGLLYTQWLSEAIASGDLPMPPPPSRTETIHALWSMTSEFWCISQENGKLTVATGPHGEFTFELMKYGERFVIECEGVVVQHIG